MLKTIFMGFDATAPLLGILLFGSTQFAVAAEAELKPDTSKPDTGVESFYAGDKLRVTVFENIARRQTETGPLYNLVERSEISGSFTVGLNGRIILPFAGSMPIINRGQQTVEQQIEDAYRNQLGGSVKVLVRLDEREPVYVTGSVARPGSAKYVPG